MARVRRKVVPAPAAAVLRTATHSAVEVLFEAPNGDRIALGTAYESSLNPSQATNSEATGYSASGNQVTVASCTVDSVDRYASP